ncbi:MAG TPA: ABC transporter permease [Gemmatimonadaceae bacterium]|nr:ABC transporter permease [Gemmatimonadaceae bacterium]
MAPSLPPAVSRSLRSLRRAPGFVAIATLSLGAALGLSTAVFALIDAMTHPRSPLRDVGQLYELVIAGRPRVPLERRELEGALSAIGGIERYASGRWIWGDVETGETVARIGYLIARPGYFELLGVRPRLGRLPTQPGDAQAGVAVVSDGLWRLRFGNRNRITGETVGIADRQYAIIGVLPSRAEAAGRTDVWIPDPAPDQGGLGFSFVRLRRGVGEKELQPSLDAMAKRLTQLHMGPTDRPFSAWLNSMRPDPLALKDFHYAMIGAAVCVLLIACANVAALMLARGVVRTRDYALRIALGAGRGEIAREVILEVVVLAVTGCAMGAIVATWAVGLMTRATPDEMRWLGFVQPQWSARVLALSAIAVFGSITIAGGFPAWRASRVDPVGPLKEGAGGTTGKAGTRFRWLVAAELTIAMTLLVGASLMVKSVWKMASYDYGFDARNVLSVRIGMPYQRRDTSSAATRWTQLVAEALQRVRAVPGVRSAAMASTCGADHNVVTTDRTIEGGVAGYLRSCTNVSADYFRTLGREIVEGRDFTDADAAAGGAVILDEWTARLLFPHERAVGRMLKLGNLASKEPWLRVVGVARERREGFTLYPELPRDSMAMVWAAIPPAADARPGIVVRGDPRSTAVPVAVHRALRGTLPPRTFVVVRPWLSTWEDSLRQLEFLALVFTLLGAASLALGAAGLFSVISYIAGQRMREFAVRIALGATTDNVLRLVLRDGLVMALAGTAVGAGLGMKAGFLLWDKMYDTYPVDVTALVAAEAVLLLTTMLACLGPALRATKANPVEVLRAA